MLGALFYGVIALAGLGLGAGLAQSLAKVSLDATIQSGVPDPNIEDMDDEAIERSIAEINEAIRRNTEKRL